MYYENKIKKCQIAGLSFVCITIQSIDLDINVSERIHNLIFRYPVLNVEMVLGMSFLGTDPRKEWIDTEYSVLPSNFKSLMVIFFLNSGKNFYILYFLWVALYKIYHGNCLKMCD